MNENGAEKAKTAILGKAQIEEHRALTLVNDFSRSGTSNPVCAAVIPS